MYQHILKPIIFLQWLNQASIPNWYVIANLSSQFVFCICRIRIGVATYFRVQATRRVWRPFRASLQDKREILMGSIDIGTIHIYILNVGLKLFIFLWLKSII